MVGEEEFLRRQTVLLQSAQESCGPQDIAIIREVGLTEWARNVESTVEIDGDGESWRWIKWDGFKHGISKGDMVVIGDELRRKVVQSE